MRTRTSLGVLVAAALLGACETVPRHEEPAAADANAAFIEGEGSLLDACALVGRPICMVGVARVDGGKPAQVTSVRVAPGRRQLTLTCMTRTGIQPDALRMFERPFPVELSPGGRYRVVARWDGQICFARLVDQRTGQDVPRLAS